MGRKKRQNNGSASQQNDFGKRPKLETGETYSVKKYRAEQSYASMDAFVRYTKSHRMYDASYVRWNIGMTYEKAFVFSCRVGGTDLGFGRGSSREAAMDCACRATFALVNAHGYKNFTLDDDCMLEPPPLNFLPPPPPPPGPPGTLPLPPLGALPHPPPGVPPPPDLPPVAEVIPQPTVTVPPPPSAISTPASITPQQEPVVPPPPPTVSLRNIKGGLRLVYDPESEGPEEVSMEERRASLARYQYVRRL